MGVNDLINFMSSMGSISMQVAWTVGEGMDVQIAVARFCKVLALTASPDRWTKTTSIELYSERDKC